MTLINLTIVFIKIGYYDFVVSHARMEGTNDLVTIDVAGKDANYLRTQINKGIEARTLKGIKVSVVNNVCFLEKV